MRKRSRKKRHICCGLLLCLVLLSGCREQGDLETAGEESETGIQIGITFDSFIIERWQRDRDVFVSTAQELGVEVNVQIGRASCRERVYHDV